MSTMDRADEKKQKQQLFGLMLKALKDGAYAIGSEEEERKISYAISTLKDLWNVPTSLPRDAWRGSIKGVKEEILRSRDVSKVKSPLAYVLLDSALEEYKKGVLDKVSLLAIQSPLQAYLINSAFQGSEPENEMSALEDLLRMDITDRKVRQYIANISNQITDPSDKALAATYLEKTLSKEAVRAAEVREKVDQMVQDLQSILQGIQDTIDEIKGIKIQPRDNRATKESKLEQAGEGAVKLGRALVYVEDRWPETCLLYTSPSPRD